MANQADKVAPIIIKKVKKVSGGAHHGGAWKVAYADFVTAMMAFFMLLWLLNVAPKDSLDGLADYFTPTTVTIATESAAGDILGGETPGEDGNESQGAISVSIPVQTQREVEQDDEEFETVGSPQDNFESTIGEFEDARLKAAAEELRQALQTVPELAQHKNQVILEQTPDGMRIQIVDKDQRSMFREGSDELYGYAIRLIEEIGATVSKLPNRIAILGHTDSTVITRADGYSNWELSADRANATRRVLVAANVSADRFFEVTGKANTEPMFPDSPGRAENRRITILVMREAPVLDPGFEQQ